MDRENLGPAERIINALLGYSDHMVHNRPGMLTPDARFIVGVRWDPGFHKVENGEKIFYRQTKAGKKYRNEKIGVLGEDGLIRTPTGQSFRYQPAGLFGEVAVWFYKQIAEVWKLDNEFAARWASYAFPQDHKDLKVALAAFMLVQSRKGEPVKENGQVLFKDEDYRAVGEAMILLRRKDKKDLDPKLILRVHDLLRLPGIAAINRELGFGRSARNPYVGRWPDAVRMWLQHREQNPKLLEGAVKGGMRQKVMELCRRVRYKPENPEFFKVLRWKQLQSKNGHRTIAIGDAVTPAETWAGLTEEQICERIALSKPGFKRLLGLLPKEVGLTQAIMASAIESGCLSDKDLIIYSPTLEELGLTEVKEVKERWEKAIKAAEDMRAANIAARMKNKDNQEKLQEAADNAVKKAAEEVTRNMRVYFMVDISGSMTTTLDRAKEHLAKFVQGFPPDRIHIATFNTVGKEVTIKHPSSAGVEQAFRGIRPGGGTDYGAGVRALAQHQPAADEDVLFIFVGDEEAAPFDYAIRQTGLNPLAFGFVRTVDPRLATMSPYARAQHGLMGHGNGTCVRDTATALQIPCFMIEETTFEDVYAIPRTIRNLIAATPVRTLAQRPLSLQPRVSLLDLIMKTELLPKPHWASAVAVQ